MGSFHGGLDYTFVWATIPVAFVLFLVTRTLISVVDNSSASGVSMRDKEVGSAAITLIVIFIAVGGVGGYMLMNEYESGEGSREYDELEPEENLITENIAKLGIKTEEIEKFFENVQNFRTIYTDDLIVHSNVGKNEFQDSGFEEHYSINGTYSEVLFILTWENELVEGEPPSELVEIFQGESISLHENAVIFPYKDEWAIGNQEEKEFFRIQKEGAYLYVERYVKRGGMPNVSVYCRLNKYSNVEGADKVYETINETTREGWNMNYDPEERANDMWEGKSFELGDESFVRYYENHLGAGSPAFGISFRERNVEGEVFVLGDIDNLMGKTVELTEVLGNRLEKA